MSALGKLRLTFKDPDALDDQIREHVADTLSDIGLDKREMDAVTDKRCERVHDMVDQWFECGEYVNIEIDLDAKPPTARLLTADDMRRSS